MTPNTNQIQYTLAGSFNADAVVYKTVLAEWQTNSPIAVLESGELAGSPRTIVKTFGFTAPMTPGHYRLRLAMTWAFAGIQGFYGDGPHGPSGNPGEGPWAEVRLTVAPMQPAIISTFTNTTTGPGGNASFAVNAVGGEPLSYQWYFNGTNISGQTSSCLSLTNLNCAQAGSYSVVVGNGFGTVTNTVVVSLLDLKVYAGLTLAGAVGDNYRIDLLTAVGSTNTWQTLTNFSLPSSPYYWFDLQSAGVPQRYYRAMPMP